MRTTAAMLVFVFSLTGCSKTVSAGPSPEIVLTLVKKILSEPPWERRRHYHPPTIEEALAAAHLNVEDVLSGCLTLLKQGNPIDKCLVGYFLGRLDDRRAIPALADALGDPESSVRETACDALSQLHATGPDLESKLLTLCREDLDAGVRVSAAMALPDTSEEDAIAAYQFGLRSRTWRIWQLCEMELERKGRLELPLPEHIYATISLDEYQAMKAEPIPRIGKEIKRNGVLYFELYSGGNDGIPIHYEWYRVKLGK